MKKIIIALVLTFALGSGVAFAAAGDNGDRVTPINSQEMVVGASVGAVDSIKDSPVVVEYAVVEQESGAFNCGVEGCDKAGTHYHKNYDPANCTNPDCPKPHSGVCKVPANTKTCTKNYTNNSTKTVKVNNSGKSVCTKDGSCPISGHNHGHSGGHNNGQNAGNGSGHGHGGHH